MKLAPWAIANARRTTHLDPDEGPALVTVAGLKATLPRRGMRTFRVFPCAPATPPPGGVP